MTLWPSERTCARHMRQPDAESTECLFTQSLTHYRSAANFTWPIRQPRMTLNLPGINFQLSRTSGQPLRNIFFYGIRNILCQTRRIYSDMYFCVIFFVSNTRKHDLCTGSRTDQRKCNIVFFFFFFAFVICQNLLRKRYTCKRKKRTLKQGVLLHLDLYL